MDLIITNPPFGGVEEDDIEGNFPKRYQTRETADLFMALIMHLLKPNGRAAVVLPDGFLFGEGVKTTLKRELLESFNLHTIVHLPKGVLSPYTNINTNILFFEKGGPTKEVWFFEHPYPVGYKSYSRSKPLTIGEFDRFIPNLQVERAALNLDFPAQLLKCPPTHRLHDKRSNTSRNSNFVCLSPDHPVADPLMETESAN